MHKKWHVFLCILNTFLLVLSGSSTMIASEAISHNTKTGYGVYIDDDAELLTASEENDLCQAMEPITAYGNIVFVSIASNSYSSVEDFAADYGYSRFGNESYTLFIIDMDYREIFIYSDGEIYETINDGYAYTITDNVYTYASDGTYYECAYHAFEQILTLLEGRSIAQPMKYISNALLAIVLALLINYFIVMHTSRSVKASNSELLSGIYTKVNVKNPTKKFLHQTKRYSPQNTDSNNGARSRSSGGFSGGSSGGGGGSRGGGGGHKF